MHISYKGSSIPNPKQLKAVPVRETKYNRLLPNTLTTLMHTILASNPITPTTTVAQFASIGIAYALKICTIYGRIEVIPLNCEIAKQKITIAKGRIVRFLDSSLIFSRRSAGGWEHLRSAL